MRTYRVGNLCALCRADWQAFDECCVLIYNPQSFVGLVAQGLEQGTHNPLVVGSKPTRPTN